MQSCPTCQYVSPAGAKFCRQCGAPLAAESEFSGAATRNYGRQEPAPAPAVSAPLPPSISDAFGADTARHYPQPPVYAPPVVSTAPIKGSAFSFHGRRFFPLLIALIIGLSMGMVFSTMHVTHDGDELSPAKQAQIEAAAALQEQNQELADHIREAQDRAREAQDRIREAQDRAREAAAQAAENGAAIPGDIKPLDLNPYEYPGASMGNYSRIPGNEMAQLRTKDSFDTLLKFYEKKLGKPLMLMNDDDDKSAFFQSATAPGVFVTIEQDEDHNGFWRITITRAPALFPQLVTPPAPPAAPAAPVVPKS